MKIARRTLRTLRILTVATGLAAMPTLAQAQDDQPPKHGVASEDNAPVSTPTPFALYGHFAIGGARTPGATGLGLLSGVTMRVGPLFVQANALDLAAEPGNNFAYDYVNDGGTTSCEDSEGEVVDDSVCDTKTPDIIRRGISVDASVFVPHTSMLVGVGDRVDHGTQTVFGSVGYMFAPDDTRAVYVLNVSAGDHYLAATIGVAFPFFKR